MWFGYQQRDTSRPRRWKSQEVDSPQSLWREYSWHLDSGPVIEFLYPASRNIKGNFSIDIVFKFVIYCYRSHRKWIQMSLVLSLFLYISIIYTLQFNWKVFLWRFLLIFLDILICSDTLQEKRLFLNSVFFRYILAHILFFCYYIFCMDSHAISKEWQGCILYLHFVFKKKYWYLLNRMISYSFNVYFCFIHIRGFYSISLYNRSKMI